MERSLRASGAFRFVERNYIVSVKETSNDPLFPTQWGLPMVGAPQAWDTTKGTGTTIAIVDTGVDATHPDLSDRVIGGFNAISGSPDASDDNGHGTRMAGIAAASGFNGVGVIGMAPEAQLMPVKVLDASGEGTYADVARGIVYATDHGANVISLSLGGAVDSSTLSNAVAYAAAHGVVVVAAAGNNGIRAPSYPAAYPAAIAVAASGMDDSRATFSNSGTWLGLTAPGVDITTTNLGGGYTASTGTSPATPFVAGAAALVLSANPQLGPHDVALILEFTSDDRGAPGFDPYWGWGRLNAGQAVAQAVALAAQPDTGTPVASITAPQDGAAIEGVVTLTAEVTHGPAVTRMEYVVDGTVVASASVPPFTAIWDTSLMSSGAHILSGTAYDATGNRGAASPITITVAGTPVDCATPGVTCLSGGGPSRTDCLAEWLVAGEMTFGQTKANTPVATCKDGAACDQDGQADGACTFNLAICFDVPGPKLVDPTGASLCAPTELSQFRLLTPVIRRRGNPIDVQNARTLLTGVAALSAAQSSGTCISGIRRLPCHTDTDCDSAPGAGDGLCALQGVSLAGTVGGSERCTSLQRVRVPLGHFGSFALPGSRSLKAVTTALPAVTTRRAAKDTDSIQLICQPGP